MGPKTKSKRQKAKGGRGGEVSGTVHTSDYMSPESDELLAASVEEKKKKKRMHLSCSIYIYFFDLSYIYIYIPIYS